MIRPATARSAAILLCVVAVQGCGSKSAPSPMRDQPVHATQKLVMALYDPSRVLDRSLLRSCPTRFPAMMFQEENEIEKRLGSGQDTARNLLQRGESWAAFSDLADIHLLLIPFLHGETRYLRIVNSLGRYVSTVTLDPVQVRCDDLLRAQRIVQIDSVPPIADIRLDDRTVGEAPLWIWLKDGRYEVTCALPGEVFSPTAFVVPRDTRIVCRRENVAGSKSENSDVESMSGEEKAGSTLVAVVGIAAAIAAIVIPLLFLF